MQIIQLTRQSSPPYKDDILLIEKEGNVIEVYKVVLIKDVGDDYEIILNRRKNTWFSWRQYAAGKSWVKDCRVVLP